MIATALDLSLALQPRTRPGSGAAGAPPVQAAGPGWFESSWDLQRGLEVSETGDAEALLRSWIEDFLGAQGGSSPAAAGVSFSAT